MAILSHQKEKEQLLNFMLISGVINTQINGNYHVAAGDVKSLILTALTLQKEFPDTEIRHRFSNNIIPETDLKRDAILVGGPKYNSITETILDYYKNHVPYFPITFQNNDIIITQIKNGVPINNELKYRKKDNFVIRDYGLLIKCPNPFNPESTLWILAGSGSRGVFASTDYFKDSFSELTKKKAKTKINTCLLQVNIIQGKYMGSFPIFKAELYHEEWKYQEFCDLGELNYDFLDQDISEGKIPSITKVDQLLERRKVLLKIKQEIENQFVNTVLELSEVEKQLIRLS